MDAAYLEISAILFSHHDTVSSQQLFQCVCASGFIWNGRTCFSFFGNCEILGFVCCIQFFASVADSSLVSFCVIVGPLLVFIVDNLVWVLVA